MGSRVLRRHGGLCDCYYEYAGTACNPAADIDGNYNLCTNQGTMVNPDWECANVDPETMDPPEPYVIVHSCGMLEWDIYDEVDAGPGTDSPGNCAVGSKTCTTTDTFGQLPDTEYDYFGIADPACDNP